MMNSLVSVVFDNHSEAERAISELRGAGVRDSAISIIGQKANGENVETDGSGSEVAKDVVGTAALGAGVGTILGIAALAIPGVGPLVAAGTIASVAVPGAAITGAAVGAAAGGIVGMLEDHGVDKDDAVYYEGRINDGATFVSVDTQNADLSDKAVLDILYNNGGHNSSRARTTTAAM